MVKSLIKKTRLYRQNLRKRKLFFKQEDNKSLPNIPRRKQRYIFKKNQSSTIYIFELI